jgi:hypothetical protein
LGANELQTSGECRREIAEVYPPVMPAKAGIQYSETSATESKTRGVLDTRRSLSSGAHSRDPVAGMTAVGGATSLRASSQRRLAMTVLDDWLFEN